MLTDGVFWNTLWKDVGRLRYLQIMTSLGQGESLFEQLGKDLGMLTLGFKLARHVE
jgi:hypothetical protein